MSAQIFLIDQANSDRLIVYCYTYLAPPSVTIRSVTKPAHSPTKMPKIITTFVGCFFQNYT